MPIVRTSLAEQAAEILLVRIREGEWEVGSKLPGETTLAEQLDVGRSTAREAIRLLAGRGIVTTRQGAGVFVRAAHPREEWGATLQRADIRAVLEARTAVEVEAAWLAAERRTKADLEAMQTALDERAMSRDEAQRYVDADADFHRAIVRAARSPILLELFEQFATLNRDAMVQLVHSNPSHGDGEDHQTHVALHQAIANKEREVAATLSRQHLRNLQTNL